MDSSDLTKIAGKAVVGMIYTSVAGPARPCTRRRRPSSTSSRRSSARIPEPYAAEAYDAATIALKAIEDAAKKGKVRAARRSSGAVRKAKLTGITGDDRLRRQG